MASAAEAGHGHVSNDEPLRYFVASRSEIDMKRKPKGSITPSMFRRAFLKGMSVVRLDRASAEELFNSAKILYDYQVAQDPRYGGIVGVVDFKAETVRWAESDGDRLCCVLDTPLENRLAHADVVHHRGAVDAETERSLKSVLFNQIGGARAFRSTATLDDSDLKSLLPACLK